MFTRLTQISSVFTGKEIANSARRRLQGTRRLGIILIMLAALLATPAADAQALPVAIATIPVSGAHNSVLGVNSNTNLVYIGDFDNGVVSVINMTTNTVVATIPGLKVNVNDGPTDIAVNSNTNFIYVGRTVHFGGQITVIDGSTNTASTIGGLGSHPVSLAVNALTNRIYVANQLSNNVSVIDGTTNSVITTIGGFSSPVGVGVNPQTNLIYVGNAGGSNSLSVIDGATDAIVTTIPLGADPFRIAVNPITNRIYASHNSTNNASIIDGSSNSVIAVVSVGSSPLGIDVNPDNGRIYTANIGSNNVSIIDGTTNTVVFTVSVGANPVGVGVNPATSRVYVTNSASNTVSVIEDIVYNFTGFFQPVDNLPVLNYVKAGQAIPVKFSLGGNQGLNIFEASYPKSQVIACNSTATVDGIEETVTAGSSSLSYDASTDIYTYVWKTEKAWANTCRQLVVKLNDGTFHRASFKFK
jgi:YVTN family beta-propeller protein